MFSFPCGTPVAGLIVLEPRVEFKPIKADALCADGHLCEVGADLRIEPVSVHAKVVWGIAKADDARRNSGRAVTALCHIEPPFCPRHGGVSVDRHQPTPSPFRYASRLLRRLMARRAW